MIRETKNDPEEKAYLRKVVEDVGDFGYTAAVLLPEYLAAVKIKKESLHALIIIVKLTSL
jgi:hypothetical protein